MPDIAMCSLEGCPKKHKCYRYKAEPCENQCYAEFEGGDYCEGFCEILVDNQPNKE